MKKSLVLLAFVTFCVFGIQQADALPVPFYVDIEECVEFDNDYTFCTIQAALDARYDENGNLYVGFDSRGETIYLSADTFDEEIIINDPQIIVGTVTGAASS